MSDVLGCSNTRTICGLKVSKHSSWGSHGSVDCGDSNFTPMTSTASMTASVSSHTSISQSTHQTGWTLETKLARAQERRKRLEGRFQRERSKRKYSEDNRDQVLDFVKGLLLGFEREEEIHSKRGKSLFQRKDNHEIDISRRTMSSIRKFLLHYDGQSQLQSDPTSSSYDSDDDDVHCYYTPNRDRNSEQEDGELSEEEFDPTEGDSVRSLRMLKDNLDDIHAEEEKRPQSPAETVYSSDSSYDESEAEDEFPELPVKFRSVQELKSDEERSDDETPGEDTLLSNVTEKEWRERDIRHAKEIEQHQEELEKLHVRIERSTQEHFAEIDSMERRFRDESLKREDLLERALSYAERLEASSKRKSKELSAKQAALEQCAHEHFQKIEAIRREQREELCKQKEEAEKESAARHAKELKQFKERHEEELAYQVNRIMQECTMQQFDEMQKLQDRHREELLEGRNAALEESTVRHAEELKALKELHEKNLDDLVKFHENELLVRAQQQEQLQQDGAKTQLRILENNRLKLELGKQDATIERLETDCAQKDKELQKLRQSLVGYKAEIDALEKEGAKKGMELEKVNESLHTSHSRIRELESEEEMRQGATMEIVSANAVTKASTTKMIRQLQEELKDRDAEIEELEQDLELALESRHAAAPGSESSSQTITKLQNNLREQAFEMDTLRNEHAKALEAVETRLGEQETRHAEEISNLHKMMQKEEDSMNQANSNDTLGLRRLKKELEEIEMHHMQELQTALREKDTVMKNLEAGHDEELQKFQSALDGTKEKHAKDIAVLVSKMNAMQSMISDQSSPEEEKTHPRDSHHLRSNDLKCLEGKTKTTNSTKWFSPKAQTAIANSAPSTFLSTKRDFDSTNRTLSSTPSSSFSSSTDKSSDDGSIGSDGSKKRSSPEQWEDAVKERVEPIPSGTYGGQSMLLSSALEKRNAAKRKPQTSRWNLMGGLTTKK